MLDATTVSLSADALIGEPPEPVRRYLHHALPNGIQIPSGVRLWMTGKIKVGFWLPFTAVQDCDERSFEWRPRCARPAQGHRSL